VQPYIQIMIGFARSGVLGYGGGPSVIPLIEYEAVKNYKWMDSDEFGETLALANTLPGPIATKMSAYIGYKVKGALGAIVAVAAHILPSLIALVGILTFFYSFRSHPFISGMVQGVTPVIAVMLFVMAFDFLKKGSKGLGGRWAMILAVFAFLLLQILTLHPGLVIAIFLISAFLFATYRSKKMMKANSGENDRERVQ